MREYTNKLADELTKNNFKIVRLWDRGVIVQITYELFIDLEYIGDGVFTTTQLLSKLSYNSKDMMLCTKELIPITMLLSKCNIKFNKHYNK